MQALKSSCLSEEHLFPKSMPEEAVQGNQSAVVTVVGPNYRRELCNTVVTRHHERYIPPINVEWLDHNVHAWRLDFHLLASMETPGKHAAICERKGMVRAGRDDLRDPDHNNSSFRCGHLPEATTLNGTSRLNDPIENGRLTGKPQRHVREWFPRRYEIFVVLPSHQVEDMVLFREAADRQHCGPKRRGLASSLKAYPPQKALYALVDMSKGIFQACKVIETTVRSADIQRDHKMSNPHAEGKQDRISKVRDNPGRQVTIVDTGTHHRETNICSHQRAAQVFESRRLRMGFRTVFRTYDGGEVEVTGRR
jgi:hypothetical protein